MIRRFFSQAWISYKGTQGAFDLEELIALKLLYTLLSLAFYCIVAAFRFGSGDLTQWVVGNAFVVSAMDCFSLSMVFTSERYYGRLRYVVASPGSKLAFVVQKGLFTALFSSASIAVNFLLGSLLFGIDFSGLNIGLFAVTMLTAMFSMAGLGVFVSLFGLLTDGIQMVNNVTESLIIIFSGANFPLSQLPPFAQYFAKILPMNRSIAAANLCFGATAASSAYLTLVLSELAVGLAYFVLTALLFGVVERIAIKKATIEAF